MRRLPSPGFSAGARLYAALIGASIRSRMQYRFDFLTSSFIQAAMGVYDFLLIAVILWKFKTIAGWDVYEVGVLYSVSRLGFGFYRMFCNELDRFEFYIVRGEFDQVLIRPWPSLFVLLTKNFDMSRLSWVIQGAAIGVVCLPHLIRSGNLSAGGAVLLVLSIIPSTLLFSAVGLAVASMAFWIVRIDELQVFALNAPSTAALYPLDVYPRWLRTLFLSVIPVAVGNYLPAAYLLGKGGNWTYLALPPVVSMLSLALAYRFWLYGQSKYHSTGS